ncbi:hypothetical protein PR003_g24404 [Phytophthora rubi]|uniref:Uncharacterized protein n=1 Tax=Phytophthora rubi TaxID=129364 RepID=A0A6A3IQG9_9STRA|nr:hypothetical protein PR002_g23601 [Phytophthora rubi]KAE8984310.1 hypothetical protein PR001_g23213 [Phytophthora rubi]KAE9293834.1 hypothetical protein PR003_g24404 [Phytophthora rubi]
MRGAANRLRGSAIIVSQFCFSQGRSCAAFVFSAVDCGLDLLCFADFLSLHLRP